jgi:uncharacterized protein (TIGR00251 family)
VSKEMSKTMALIIDIKVVPSAKKNQWKLEQGRLKCYLKSPPEKGKANNELIMLLAEILKIRPSAIIILSGATSRLKRIKIDADVSFARLLELLGLEQQKSLFEA